MSGGLVGLTVRLQTPRADRHVTADVHDVTFRSTAPGGFASASITLSRPLSLQPDEIAYYANLYVYDARNGNVVWQGRLEDPGRALDGTKGEVWNINAVGPAAHAQDVERPLIYADTQISDMFRVDNATAPTANGGMAEDPGGTSKNALVLSFPQGLTLATNDRVCMRYYKLVASGQKLAGYAFTVIMGNSFPTLYHAQSQVYIYGGGGSQPTDIGFGSSSPTPANSFIGSGWTNSGQNAINLRIIYLGAGGTLGDDNEWASFYDFKVIATRYDKNGNEIVSGYGVNDLTPKAHQIVADLLGRVLPKYDGPNASIATNTYAIDQLAYPDGVTPAKVLDDLMDLEPAYYWAAWESNPITGKYRFEWLAWPTTVRYEATAVDGIDSPGSAVDLYNQVRARWKAYDGSIQTTQRTQTVQILTDAGLTREAYIDLGDNIGSTANSIQAADAFLADHAAPPNAGTLRISRPIPDYVTGRMVMPWEIRPGQLIRVRGILPRVNSLNASARDGVTVFRIIAVTYTASSATAELELDSYPVTVSTALAALAKTPTRRR
jgi:hypothetical protein